jgi:hypothetical protein
VGKLVGGKLVVTVNSFYVTPEDVTNPAELLKILINDLTADVNVRLDTDDDMTVEFIPEEEK